MGGASHGGRGGPRLAGQVAMGGASLSGMRSHGSPAAGYLEGGLCMNGDLENQPGGWFRNSIVDNQRGEKQPRGRKGQHAGDLPSTTQPEFSIVSKRR